MTEVHQQHFLHPTGTRIGGSLKPGRLTKCVVFLIIPALFASGMFARESGMLIEAAGYYLGILGYLTYRWQRRRFQRRLNDNAFIAAKESNNFILYLRPFFTSHRLVVRNNLPSILDRLLVGKYWDAELALSFAFEDLSPVVAIGDKFKSYGAAKITTSDSSWKNVFADLAERSRLIFVVPFVSPGTIFEMEFIKDNEALRDKLIILMPPSYISFRQLFRVIFRCSHQKLWKEAQSTFKSINVHLPNYHRKGGFYLMDGDGACRLSFPIGRFDKRHITSLEMQVRAAYDVRDDSTKFTSVRSTIQIRPRSTWVRWVADRFVPSIPTTVWSLTASLVIRTFLFQPFNIPAGSMKETLLVGDYLFVSKFSYGYTHYSLPSSPDLFSGRIWASPPNRGDVVVFRLPKDDSTDYIKRVIGLPGDRIQMIEGVLHINGEPVKRERIEDFIDNEEVGRAQRVKRWRETLPNGVSYTILDLVENGFLDNTQVYHVPPGHYFMMGDNRDNSTDSRVLSQVGYVPFENIVGRAQIIFFSILEGEDAWMVWLWPSTVRWNRVFRSQFSVTAAQPKN